MDKAGGSAGGSSGGGGGGYKGRRSAEQDKYRIFVGAVPNDCDEITLREYFERYGPVIHVDVKRDALGTPRGFAFILFDCLAPIDEINADRPHVINGRTIDPKPVVPQRAEIQANKVFIGGLSVDNTEEQLREAIALSAPIPIDIVNVQWPMDEQRTNDRRHYLFIEVANEKQKDVLLKVGELDVAGSSVDIKRRDPNIMRRTPQSLPVPIKKRWSDGNYSTCQQQMQQGGAGGASTSGYSGYTMQQQQQQPPPPPPQYYHPPPQYYQPSNPQHLQVPGYYQPFPHPDPAVQAYQLSYPHSYPPPRQIYRLDFPPPRRFSRARSPRPDSTEPPFSPFGPPGGPPRGPPPPPPPAAGAAS